MLNPSQSTNQIARQLTVRGIAASPVTGGEAAGLRVHPRAWALQLATTHAAHVL